LTQQTGIPQKAGGKQKPCTLDKPVAEFVDFIFSKDMFKSNLERMGLDVSRMPLGALSQDQVDKANEVLVDISKELKKKKPSKQKLQELSSSFFTRFPHSFGRQKAPVIDNEALLQDKFDLVAVVSDVEQAQQMTRAAEAATEHPLDAKFKTLNADLEAVTDANELKWINKYIKASAHDAQMNMTLLQVFKVARFGEEVRFSKHKLDNRSCCGMEPALL